jgi:hypothetical protein
VLGPNFVTVRKENRNLLTRKLVWMGSEILALTGIRSIDRPTRSESLYDYAIQVSGGGRAGRILVEVVVGKSWYYYYYSDICPEVLNETTKNLSRNAQYSVPTQ